MNEPQDYEYSGRQSRYPPVWELLGYFGLGIGTIWLSVERLSEFSQLENTALSGRLQPMIRVWWPEKLLYELGGKYAVLGFGLIVGIGLIGFGVWRLRGWLTLRNGG